jgi:polysaccharide pyruvyl transferase WcaK-like protein
MKKVLLLGNNSGRNLGDATILASILSEFSKSTQDVEFLVPSIAPDFIDDNYAKKFNVRGINVLPWTGSIRLLGLPTIRAIFKSDIALICDGIIFGRKLFSPHNFLITLFFLLPFFWFSRCKLICYLTGIGPFPSALSKFMARTVINSCERVIMRDEDSIALAKEIGVTRQIEMAGDAAFLNEISSSTRAKEIMAAEGIDTASPIIGFNITSYLDGWLSSGDKVGSRTEFVDGYAQAVKLAEAAISANFPETKSISKVVICCSPMDLELSELFASMIGAKVVSNSKYLSHDIQAVMREMALMVGMRFHSIILSSSAGVPVIGMIYMPKVKGYFSLIGTPELGMMMKNASAKNLAEAIVLAYQNRSLIKSKQQAAVLGLRQSAAAVTRDLSEKYLTAVKSGAATATVA